MKKNGNSCGGILAILFAVIISFVIWLGTIALAAWVIFSVFNAIVN